MDLGNNYGLLASISDKFVARGDTEDILNSIELRYFNNNHLEYDLLASEIVYSYIIPCKVSQLI